MSVYVEKMLIKGHSSSGLLKLLSISMAAIAFGHAMGEISFEDDYPCRGILCMWVSPPPVLDPCGPLGGCSSSPTPHRRSSKSAGQFGAAPGPLEGQPSLPPSVWEAPPPPPPIVPDDPIAAPPTC